MTKKASLVSLKAFVLFEVLIIFVRLGETVPLKIYDKKSDLSVGEYSLIYFKQMWFVQYDLIENFVLRVN